MSSFLSSRVTTTGRALLWLALASVAVGVGGTWYFVQQGDGRSAEGAVAIPEEGQGEVSPGPRTPSPEVARLETPVPPESAGPAPIASRGGLLEGALAAPSPGRGRSLRAAPDRERIRELFQGDPARRLTLAREILAESASGMEVIRALDVLAELAPEEAASFLLELPTGESALRVSASLVQRLARKGVLGDDDLRALYERGGDDVRSSTAALLEERGDPSLMHSYLQGHREALASREPRQRMMAARQLALMDNPTATKLLVGLLEDEDEGVRMQGVRSLGRNVRDAGTIDALRPLLQDPSERVRDAARRTVERMERVQGAQGGDGRGRRR